MNTHKTFIATAMRNALSIAIVLFAGVGLAAAGEETQKERSAQELIQSHCVRCHLAPEPEDLSREYWSYAIHYMGNYIGMKGDEFDDLTVSPVPPDWEPQKDYTKRYILSDKLGYMRDLYPFKPYIPPEPEMSKAEFVRLRKYFLDNAKSWPDMEIKRAKQPLMKGFTPVIPKLDLEPNALVLATQVDEKRRRLYVGRSVIDDWVGGGGRREGYDKWDDVVVLDIDSGKRLARVDVSSDPIDFTLTETGVRVLTHGRFPMTKVGIAALTDWEFEGDKPRARMLGRYIWRCKKRTGDLLRNPTIQQAVAGRARRYSARHVAGCIA